MRLAFAFRMLVLAAPLLTGCSSGATGSKTPASHGGAAKPGAAPSSGAAQGEQQGLASYYADSLAGHPTASGEPYDPAELTAAHRTLPLGTRIRVTRDDGRSVVVRVNDRGPFGSKKRIVDLSRHAAETLGMVRAGVVPVTVRVLGKP
jgi:rare lipoprotein A